MHRWELNCGHRVAASGSLRIKTWWGLETPVPTSPSECWSPGPSSTVSAKPPGAALPWVCVQVETAWEPAEWLSTGGIENKKSRHKSWRSLLTGSSWGLRAVTHFLLPPGSLARPQRNCRQQSQEDSETLCSVEGGVEKGHQALQSPWLLPLAFRQLWCPHSSWVSQSLLLRSFPSFSSPPHSSGGFL